MDWDCTTRSVSGAIASRPLIPLCQTQAARTDGESADPATRRAHASGLIRRVMRVQHGEFVFVDLVIAEREFLMNESSASVIVPSCEKRWRYE